MDAQEPHDAAGDSRIRVWDAPTRIFHWLYVACFVAAWLMLDAARLDWHVLAGYIALGLLVFRVAWGFVGTRHARFRSFAAGPRAVAGYLRGIIGRKSPHLAGHNPAGGWSILAMLALGLAIGASGIVALGAMHGYGPLAVLANSDSALALRELHEILAWILLALVPIHLAGVALGSFVNRENLVRAMIDGRKSGLDCADAVAPHTLLACLMVAVAAAGAFAYRRHADDAISSAGKAPHAPADANAKAWNEECGSCHFAFPPALAPARVWLAMIDPATTHFGETLDLSAGRRAQLEHFAAAHSAEHEAGWVAERTRRADWGAQRITATPFWRRLHRDLDFEALKRSGRVAAAYDCGACHRDAASGKFEPRAIQSQ